MRIEKRLPFGFHGDWGKLYKRYTKAEKIEIKDDKNILYENNYYTDIGMDVQFKRVNDTTASTEQTAGLLSEAQYTTVETTDAYFENARREYLCVVASDDIVRVFGRLWIVTSVRTVSKYTPAEQKFFYCELKGIA